MFRLTGYIIFVDMFRLTVYYICGYVSFNGYIIFVDMFRLTVYYICGYDSFNCILYLWICFV